MENFDGESIDELLEICQICQYFPPSKFCTIQQTTSTIIFKSFPGTLLLLKVYHCEGFSNWNKTDRMVTNHLSSCSSLIASCKCIKIANNCSQILVMLTGLITGLITDAMVIKLL